MANFGSSIDLSYSRRYLNFWKEEIESRDQDYFTIQEILDKFNSAFLGILTGNDTRTSFIILNTTVEQFGQGGTRQIVYSTST